MRYKEIQLAVEKEEAEKLIAERISNIRVDAAEDRIEYRTNADILLASLSEIRLPSGDPGSKLRYRTALIDNRLSYVKRQAWSIKQAVNEWAVN